MFNDELFCKIFILRCPGVGPVKYANLLKQFGDVFTVADSLRENIGDGIIISFKDGAFLREVSKSDVTIIKFLRDDGINYLTKSVDDIISTLHSMQDIAGLLFSTKHTVPETESVKDIMQNDNDNTILNEPTILNENEQAPHEPEPMQVSPQPDSDIAEKSQDGMKILLILKTYVS